MAGHCQCGPQESLTGFKKFFLLRVSMISQQCWKAKLGRAHFFKVQSGKTTVCLQRKFFLAQYNGCLQVNCQSINLNQYKIVSSLKCKVYKAAKLLFKLLRFNYGYITLIQYTHTSQGISNRKYVTPIFSNRNHLLCIT